MPTSPYQPEPKDIPINSSAAELRTYTLAFVSFLLYVLITTASTKHEQLLRVSPVKLPLLDIDIPIVGFYVVAPILILILHFHLLLQHFLFSQQYYQFEDSLIGQYSEADRVKYMKTLSGNMSLVHLLGNYQKNFVQFLLACIVAICLLFFPLFDLWFLQAKFLPFHNTTYTNFQCLMVVFDCVMILILLPKMLDKDDNAWQWWINIFLSPIILIKRAYYFLLKAFFGFFYTRGSLRIFRVQIMDATALLAKKTEFQRRYDATLLIRIISLKHFLTAILLFSFLVSIFTLSVFVSILPQLPQKKVNLTEIDVIKNDIKTFRDDRETWLLELHAISHCNNYEYSHEDSFFQVLTHGFCKVRIDKSTSDRDRRTLLLTAVLHENMYDIQGNKIEGNSVFLRNMDLFEKTITADEKLSNLLENTIEKSSSLAQIVGIDLNQRDLRYANFNGAKLPKAKLKDAKLQGAYLQSANLQGTDLKSANLQDAYLDSANLQGADLRSANLHDTHLKSASLQGAYLQSANLQGADLRFANLKGANLQESANLQDTDLEESANLQDTDLEESANLQDTDLEESANLQDTGLMSDNLKSTNLTSANLQGAKLTSADWQRANLTNAILKGAYFSAEVSQQDSKTDNPAAYASSSNSGKTMLEKFNLDAGKTMLEKFNLDAGKKLFIPALYISELDYQSTEGYIFTDRETNESSTTDMSSLIEHEKQADIRCLTDDKIDICENVNGTDTQTLNKITEYWINDLACSDQWTAQGIIINFLNDKKFKKYLIPLLNEKLSDKNLSDETCPGIKNLPDEIKQDIRNKAKSLANKTKKETPTPDKKPKPKPAPKTPTSKPKSDKTPQLPIKKADNHKKDNK